MPFQMALDEIIFRELIENAQNETCETAPILRFYHSSEPWVTVGYSHPQDDSFGRIPVCKRITGGGKVEHGNDLIFSLVAHKSHDESFTSVRVSYWKIHEAVKLGMEKVGKSPRFYRCDEKLPRGGDCFTFPISSDLGLEGKKIAGGAQKRSGRALLHQESIPLRHGLEFEALAGGIIAGFEQVFGVNVESTVITPEKLKCADALAIEKYSPLVMS